MKKDKLCKKIATQKKQIEEYESAVEQLKGLRSLRNNWRKLMKRGKLQEIHFWRHLSFMGPSDVPVDMSKIWNWMVKYDRAECKAFYAAVSSMLDGAIKDYSSKVRY